MATTETVSFTIGGRYYKLACGPGEAGHLQKLAQRLDTTAQQTLRRHGALREEMLLMLVGLTLADELFEDVLRPAIFEGTPQLLEGVRRSGCRVVLVTGALDFTVRRLAEHLGADDVIANRMRFVNGVATGRVVPPIIEGAHKAQAIRDYCVKHRLPLERSFAYSDSFSDYPMLAVVGHPAAVNPDARLAGVARAYEWPILTTTEA